MIKILSNCNLLIYIFVCQCLDVPDTKNIQQPTTSLFDMLLSGQWIMKLASSIGIIIYYFILISHYLTSDLYQFLSYTIDYWNMHQWVRIVLRYSPIYKADFILGVLKNKDRKLAQTFNSSFRYIDDVLPLSNSRFCHYLHRIYPNELEVENTTDTQKSASYLDLHLEIDIG